mmetsp:Transcript_1062/g.2197  ORF Transcript_1062/g.2197 Transcript_1062/m.2197 type:complete len:275 (-) Transcript_1062:1596-2420(-)
MSASKLNIETRWIVHRHESAQNQISRLTHENRSLKEQIRENEIKVLGLISHYQNEIECHAQLVCSLKRDLLDLEKERGGKVTSVSDKSTRIDDGDFQSRESDLQQLVIGLKKQVGSLKRKQIIERKDFERKSLINRAEVKKSLENNVDAIKRLASEAVCNEVRGALEATLRDNESLAQELKSLLFDMEMLQKILEKKDQELNETRRELAFAKNRVELLTRRFQGRLGRSDGRKKIEEITGKSTDGTGDHTNNSISKVDVALRSYFASCIEQSSK